MFSYNRNHCNHYQEILFLHWILETPFFYWSTVQGRVRGRWKKEKKKEATAQMQKQAYWEQDPAQRHHFHVMLYPLPQAGRRDKH